MLAINLGCGESRITTAINIDMNPCVKPDLVFDIRKPFPLRDKSVSKVYLFHCIEHIERFLHYDLLREIHRIFEDDGILLISYPEISKIMQNWLDHKNCDRSFWMSTIYGRQKYAGDYHYSGMDTTEFKELLFGTGFQVDKVFSEPTQDHNTVVRAIKGIPPKTYEEVLYNELFQCN